MLIAIDASTTATGYAFGGPDDGSPKGGVWKLPGAEEHVFDTTLARAADSVSDLCRMLKAHHVVIEAPLMIVGNQNSAHTAMALMQLTGAVRAAAKRAGADVHLVGVSTVRKHFVGKGNLKKSEAKGIVMERCLLLGWDIGSDNNRADAAAVWAWGMSRYYPRWAPCGTPLFSAGRQMAT